MALVSFVTPLHTSSKRDYLARMNAEKPKCMRAAKQFGKDYWDGDRKFGYGGYHYDGRWKPVAKEIIAYYGLKGKTRILDIGCGKGHLLYEMGFLGEPFKFNGIDISDYAIDNASTVSGLFFNNCTDLPFKNSVFDFTYSINVFHNLKYRDLKQAIREMVRVGKDKMYICVESYRNEQELTNLQAWQLTCLSYYSPDDWLQIYEDCGYTGDYEFIYFI